MPFLLSLIIGQMCTALEPAIISLVKDSNCHPITLRLLNPGGSWIISDEFTEFLAHWKDRLELDMGLPFANQEKGQGGSMIDQEDVMEHWVFLLKWYLSALGLTISIFYLYTSVYPTI
jgi:hypothetical protein